MNYDKEKNEALSPSPRGTKGEALSEWAGGDSFPLPVGDQEGGHSPLSEGDQGGDFFLETILPDKNYFYNPDLRSYASKLRKRMTKAEACLWKYALRARKMKGRVFNRQRPVLNYIADFMCKELKLVIEVDGMSHLWEETKKKDKRKDSDLTRAGFCMLRFTDSEVLTDIGSVIVKIERIVDERAKALPLNSPPPRGGKRTSSRSRKSEQI